MEFYCVRCGRKKSQEASIVLPPICTKCHWAMVKRRKQQSIRKTGTTHPKSRKKVRHCDYVRYIGSSRWAKKRQAAFEFHGRLCSECGSTERLTVHHKTYRNLGREQMDELQILCSDCHGLKHEDKYIAMDELSREYANICR